MSKTYFNYLFKSKKGLWVFIWIVNALIFTSILMGTNIGEGRFIVCLTAACILLGIETIVIVPLFYNYIHNKKAVDTYFSLPVTRKEMLFTSQLFINISVLAPFLVFSITSLIVGIKDAVIASYGSFALIVLFAIISVIVFVAFETTIFLEANSTFDGVVLIFSYLIMPLFIFIVIQEFQERFIAGVNPINVEQIIPYISLPTAVVRCEAGLAEYLMGASDSNSLFMPIQIVLLINLLWHFLVSVYALRKNFIERQVERAETISNRFYSYPFIIYFYTTILILITSLSFVADSKFDPTFDIGFSISIIILFVLFMIANFVYRRKIEFKFKDIIFFVFAILVSIAFSNIAYKTKGFGLYNVYDHNPKNIGIVYNAWTRDGELFESVKKSYPDTEEVSVMFEISVDANQMNSKKDVVKMINELRETSINNFYNGTENNAYISIATNYDESEIDKGMFAAAIDSQIAGYYSGPCLSIDDLIKYKDEFTYLTVDINTIYECKTIAFEELLKTIQAQS